jgi:hypothetical protein
LARGAPGSTSGGGYVFSGGAAPTTSDYDRAEEARRLGDIERDHWEYVQRENDNVDALIEHQRIDDQTQYDTYVDPGPSYDSSYDSYSYSTPSYDSYDY